jgi:hypothetical protein
MNRGTDIHVGKLGTKNQKLPKVGRSCLVTRSSGQLHPKAVIFRPKMGYCCTPTCCEIAVAINAGKNFTRIYSLALRFDMVLRMPIPPNFAHGAAHMVHMVLACPSGKNSFSIFWSVF